jgi:programmed cell death protein 5
MYEQKDSASRKDEGEDKEKKALRENIMRMALTSEARQRLANIRMVKPQIAQSIEDYIIQLASSGKLKQVINDDQLKEILGSVQTKKREFSFKRI